MPTPTAEDLLRGAIRWTEIETHTPDIEALSRLLSIVAEEAASFGASVERLPGEGGERDHLLVSAPWGTGNEPYVLVLSHLDTVHPKGTIDGALPIRIEGDRAYGPGIYDMKAGAYLGLAALRSLAEDGAGPPLPARILFTTDEEVGSDSSRALIERLADGAKYVLVTEPARNGGRIVTARKAVGRFTLMVEGRPAHAGARHWQGRSAIRELAHQVLALEAMTDYDQGITVNVGEITGGTGVNVVPQFASAEIDLRVATMAAADEMVQRILGLAPVGEDVEVTVTGGLNRPPFEQTPASADLFEHARRLAAEIGFDLVGEASGGGSDGNFVAHRVPTLDGLGADGDGAHTLQEHILISSLVPRMLLMRRLMETLD